MKPLEVTAVSGGKDSTAMALRAAEVEPNPERVYLTTPTGDELPEMTAHMAKLEELLGAKLTTVTVHTLDSLIEQFGALPNWRQRWCTRMLKVEPCIAWIRKHAAGREVILNVGLRADEPERRGLYTSDVTTRFPMREWGWGIDDVKRYLAEKGVSVPARTDCARCYGQRLGEWHALWKDYPDIYRDAEEQEVKYEHTFRSGGRDTWPAALSDLREMFEAGHVPRGHKLQLPMFDDEEEGGACRLCRM